MSSPENNPQTTSAPPSPVSPGMPAGSETMRTSIFLPPMLAGIDQGPPLPSALNAAPTAFSLMQAFQRRWPLAIGAGLLAAALSALIICFIFPAKFASYYCVKINSAKRSDVIGDRNDESEFNVIKLTQAQIAKNRPVILRALDYQINGRYIKDLSIVRASSDPVDWLQAAIKTDFLKAPEIMTTTLSADQAEEVTLLLNALAKSLIEENEIQEKNKTLEKIEKMQGTAKQQQNELELKRRILNTRLAAIGPNPVTLGKKLDTLEQDLRDVKKSLRDKQSEIAGVRSRMEQLTKRIDNPNAVPVPEQFLNELLRQEPDALEYFKQIADAKTEYDRASRNLDPGSPLLRPYLQRMEQTNLALDAFRRSKLPALTQKFREKAAIDGAIELTKLRDDLGALEHQEVLLNSAVERLDSEIRGFRPGNLPVDLQTMQSEIDSYEEAIKKATQQIQFMKFNAQPESRISILQDAIEPHSKDTSRQLKFVGAGSMGMFLLTVLGVSFMEFRSRKITSADEVKRGLGLNVIGTVPTLPDKARSPMSQSKLDPYWQNQLMESVDTIRTMLLHSARSNNTRVIMVTSAVGGEGKTSLSSQLAASLARAWKKTLLIDGDLRNPAAHKVFDIPQEPGFSEVLRGELTAPEAVRSTPLSRLWVLPAGHWDSHAVQALAQDNVRTMLEELKQQYDFIILDSCPVLPVADSLLLGQNVDGVLLTVMREVSRSPAVYAAQQRLESLGIKTLGAVVIGAKNELGPLGYKHAHQARP